MNILKRKPKVIHNPDGSTFIFRKNGTLSKYIKLDKSVYLYSDDGKVCKYIKPDGSEFFFREDGTICKMKIQDVEFLLDEDENIVKMIDSLNKEHLLDSTSIHLNKDLIV